MDPIEQQRINKVIESVIPKLEATIDNLVAGKYDLIKQQLTKELGSGLWDKAMVEIGKLTGLPQDVVTKLQQIDNIVDTVKGDFSTQYSDLKEKYEGYLEKIKGVDLNETVTITYSKLLWLKIRTAIPWGIICYFLGYFMGK